MFIKKLNLILLSFLILNFIKFLKTNEYLVQTKPSLITNITTSIGKTVFLNCSLNRDNNYLFRSVKSTTNTLKLNPTWLKADSSYNQYGLSNGFKTEKIIVTRKGIILDSYKDKIKLITNNNNDQILKISDVVISDEGKYICREFSTQVDKVYYLNVHCKTLKTFIFVI